jgi:hypothetical protein
VQALLARLSRLNPTRVFLGTIAFLLGGLLLPRPVGGLLLLALAGALAALLTVTWSHHAPATRISRVAILVLLVVLAVLKLG